jgi:hypothetical protein
MKAKEVFDYKNPTYAPLKEPAKEVVGAYQTAARFFDTVQEVVLIEHGLIHTARAVHKVAHLFPQRFDAYIDMLHERHLMGIYPATPELVEPINDMDKAFEIIIGVLDDIQEALEKFHAVTDNAMFRPMALKTEELMLQNSQEYTKFLNMWVMWDMSDSKTSFDNWVLHMEEGEPN